MRLEGSLGTKGHHGCRLAIPTPLHVHSSDSNLQEKVHIYASSFLGFHACCGRDMPRDPCEFFEQAVAEDEEPSKTSLLICLKLNKGTNGPQLK